jgi:hypothetical protein
LCEVLMKLGPSILGTLQFLPKASLLCSPSKKSTLIISAAERQLADLGKTVGISQTLPERRVPQVGIVAPDEVDFAPARNHQDGTVIPLLGHDPVLVDLIGVVFASRSGYDTHGARTGPGTALGLAVDHRLTAQKFSLVHEQLPVAKERYMFRLFYEARIAIK